MNIVEVDIKKKVEVRGSVVNEVYVKRKYLLWNTESMVITVKEIYELRS